MRTLFKVAKMYKSAQAPSLENESVKDEIEAFVNPEIVKLFDAEVNAPNAPEGTVVVKVNTNSKINTAGEKPVVTVNVQGNTPEITQWAIKAFNKIKPRLVNRISQIASKATAPFDADTVIERTY
jgi:hypothetical protein